MTKSEVIRKIYTEIDNLPPIPDNIAKIQQLINDPKADISMISEYVKRDVGLTANILRTANSPWYMPVTRVNTVDRAISLIGLRRLYSIVMAIGAKKIISDRFGSIKDAWKHSYKCAFYSQNLMKLRKSSVEEVEMSYIAGLLHDMGKVVFLSLSRTLINRITKLSEEKHVSIQEIEKSALGLTHAEVGGKIASKWKFPHPLVEAITLHHNPELVRRDFESMVYTVYLANIFCQTPEPDDTLISDLNSDALAFFEIQSSRQLIAIISNLNESYAISPEIRFL